MIIVMRHDATPAQVAAVVSTVQAHGCRTHLSDGDERTVGLIPCRNANEPARKASRHRGEVLDGHGGFCVEVIENRAIGCVRENRERLG